MGNKYSTASDIITHALKDADHGDQDAFPELIDALKRTPWREGERLGVCYPWQGPKGPTPTREEWIRLVDDLLNWGWYRTPALIPPAIPMKPLLVLRSLVTRMGPGPLTSGAILPEPQPLNWATAIHEADDQTLNPLLKWFDASAGWFTHRPGPTNGNPQAPPAMNTTTSPSPAPDGTIEKTSIWLNGKTYKLTPDLRRILAYLLSHPGVSVAKAADDLNMTDSKHLYTRLDVLRDRLHEGLRGSGKELVIKLDGESHISCEWIPTK